MRSVVALGILVACGGEPAPTPKPTPPPPAAAAPAAPEVVGPEGPTDLALPAGFAVGSDADTLAKGRLVFEAKGCPACHKFGEKLVGPDLKGVGERRKPEWIARMILHSGAMVKRDPVARQMFRELMVEMPSQGVGDEEIGPLVSYLLAQK